MNKPKFDPNKPFSTGQAAKPKFDASKPFDTELKAPVQQGYDYSNVKQVASDLGAEAAKGLKETPEMIGSAIGETIAGPVGSGIGGAIGKSVSDVGQGVVSAIKEPAEFIKDLGRLPTKEQVISQVNDYLTSFGLNVAAPAAVRKVGELAKGVSGQGVKKMAGEMAEKATGATGVQASKFKPQAGQELLERGLVKFGDTPEMIAKRTGQAVETAESGIDNALKALDEKGIKIKVSDVADRINSQIVKLKKNPAQADVVRKLETILGDIQETGEEFISPSLAEETKRGFNKIAGNWIDPEKGQAGKIAYRTYRDLVEETALKEAPEISKLFKESKQTYGLLAPIQEASERRAQQLKQSPIGGLLDVAAAGGAGAAIGGVEGLATGVAVAAARKAVAPRIASSTAVSLNEVSKILEKTPEYTKLLRDSPAQFSSLVKAVHDSFKDDKKKFPVIVRKDGMKTSVKNQLELDEAKSEGWR